MTDETDEPTLTRRRAIALGGVAAGGLALSNSGVLAQADDGTPGGDETPTDEGTPSGDGESGMREYRVTVANLTRGQPFTPPAVALHEPSVDVFSVGSQASEVVQELAENGNLQPLLDLIDQTDEIRGAGVGDMPLVPEEDPGGTGNPYYTTLEISADASATHLTFLSMLVATNDGFAGLDTVELPQEPNASKTLYANAYDAGTERNTEQFQDLVPAAKTLIVGGNSEGTDQSNPDLAEQDVIRPHPGIQGEGDLAPETYGWNEPVALVQVERIDGTGMPATPTETPGNETATPGNETATPGNETATPGNETATPGTETETAGGTETETAGGTETETAGGTETAMGGGTETAGGNETS